MRKLTSLAPFIALAALAAVPAAGSVVYDNTNGFVNNFDLTGFTISAEGSGASIGTFNDFAVADSFELGANQTIQSINLWLWEPGSVGEVDDLSSLSWSIVANNGGAGYPFSGFVVASGTDSSPGTYLETNTNGPGYPVFEEFFNTGGVALTGGTEYWLIIDNAVSVSGDPIYWDESSGASSAYQLGGGSSATIAGSETFTLSNSGAAGPLPEPGSVFLLGSGLVGLGLLRRRQSKKHQA
jgi:hypothetical protein